MRRGPTFCNGLSSQTGLEESGVPAILVTAKHGNEGQSRLPAGMRMFPEGVTSTMRENDSAVKTLSIEGKIREADELYTRWETALRDNPKIRQLLEALEQQAAASCRAMIDYGIVEACRHCDEEEGGSCCGAGIEDYYTPVLLLINRLLGVTLPRERAQEKGCYFLGGQGCTLKARQVLCVNYLCRKIEGMLKLDDLITLQKTTGEELDTVFFLHEEVKKCMAR